MSSQDSADDEHHGRLALQVSALPSGHREQVDAYHPKPSTDQGPFAAKEVDSDDEEDCGGDRLDRAVDTGGEKRRIGLAHADSLEDFWSIVSNTVCSRELLPEHDQEREEEPFPDVWVNAILHGVLGGLEATHRLPFANASFQVTPSVAFNSSSIEARISASSCTTSGWSGSSARDQAKLSAAF